jgi:GWxTD domain-containing protein
MKQTVRIPGTCKIVLIVLSLLITMTFIATAQVNRPKRLVINCDVAQFRNTSELGYLEWYLAFSPLQLTLHQQGGTVSGGVNITVRLWSEKKSEPVLRRRYYFPVQITDTTAAGLNKMMVSQRGYEIPFGMYRFEIVAIDSFDRSHVDSLAFEHIEVSPAGTMPRGSDLELCSNITASTDTTNLFYKNTLNVLPNPSRVFGKTGYPVVFHYLELYNLNKDSLYTVEVAMIDQTGEIKKNASRQKRYGVKNAVEVGTTAIVNLPSGKYIYRVRILDGSQKELIAVSKYLYINNPQVKPVSSPISVRAVEFLGMSSDDLDHEFHSAKYITTDAEIKTYSKITTKEAKREFLAKFWSEVEGGQHGQMYLTRSIYLDRVATANQRYHAMGREGWQTDRGRVFLLYAEPDEVERFPSTDNGKPYEIWDYNQIENGVIFVFIDRNGFGDYQLVHSTKRGEIQDESWQKYLQ